MVFDTDILIWSLRGSMLATKAIMAAEAPAISVVNYMELVRGARDRRELASIRRYIKDGRFRILPLTEAIGDRASVYIEEYALKSAMSLEDALIAATAVENGEVLYSGNAKHFRPIKELELKQFRPG